MSEDNTEVRYDAWMRRHPPHPGSHIYHGYLEAVEGVNEGMGVGAAARKLGVSRETLSRVLNGRGPITVAMALKLEAVGWGAADWWLGLQTRYDLAQERNRLGQWPPPPADESGTASEAA